MRDVKKVKCTKKKSTQDISNGKTARLLLSTLRFLTVVLIIILIVNPSRATMLVSFTKLQRSMLVLEVTER